MIMIIKAIIGFEISFRTELFQIPQFDMDKETTPDRYHDHHNIEPSNDWHHQIICDRDLFQFFSQN